MITVSGISVDLARPPFCVIRHPRVHNPEDFAKLFVDLRATLPRDIRWAVLIDLRDMSVNTGGAEVREAASAAILENVEFLKDITICEARVASGVIRGVLTVLDWVTPRPWPVRVFGNGELAENWLRDRLAAEGIEAPAARIWDEQASASSS